MPVPEHIRMLKNAYISLWKQMRASTCSNVLKALSGALSGRGESTSARHLLHERGGRPPPGFSVSVPLARPTGAKTTQTDSRVGQSAERYTSQNKHAHLITRVYFSEIYTMLVRQYSIDGPRLSRFFSFIKHRCQNTHTHTHFSVSTAILCKRIYTHTLTARHKEKSRGMQGMGTEC